MKRLTLSHIAHDLSAAARADLIAFCAGNLKDGIDATRYADGLIDAADFGDRAHFEIRGMHTRTGNPATISFECPADFVFSEIDEDGSR